MGLLNLLISIKADGSNVESTLKKIGSEVDKFGKKLATAFLGGAAVTATVAWMKSTTTAAGQIKDLGEQLDTTSVKVMQMQKAAASTGLEMSAFETAITKFGNARNDALDGNEAAIRKLLQFGITMDDIKNSTMGSVEGVYKMAEALKSMDLTPQQRSDLNDILGKGGSKMVGALREMGDVKPLASNQAIANLDKAGKMGENALWKGKDLSMAFLGGLAPVDREYLINTHPEVRAKMEMASEEARKKAKAAADDKYKADLEGQKLILKNKEEIEKAQADRAAAREKNRMASMTDEEKKAELTSIRDYARNRLSSGAYLDPVTRARMGAVTEELTGEIDELGRKKPGLVHTTSRSNLASYGNFIYSAAGRAGLDIAHKQLEVLREIRRNTTSHPINTGSFPSNI